jgi:hypothetical protein
MLLIYTGIILFITERLILGTFDVCLRINDSFIRPGEILHPPYAQLNNLVVLPEYMPRPEFDEP